MGQHGDRGLVADDNDRARVTTVLGQDPQDAVGAQVVNLLAHQGAGGLEAVAQRAGSLTGTGGRGDQEQVCGLQALAQLLGQQVRQGSTLGGQGTFQVGDGVVRGLGVADEHEPAHGIRCHGPTLYGTAATPTQFFRTVLSA